VAGVGNIFRRDDGFGPEVARRLAEGAGPDSRQMLAVDYGIRGMHLAYDLLAGVDLLVLVDTVPPDAPGEAAPGSIRVLRVRPEDLDGTASLDPHGMDPAAVLGRLRSLGGELPLTYVVGCVPADVSDGIGLSAPVAAAVPGAVEAVVELIAQYDSSVPRPVPG
jgi:hydrogenase maturation protease